MCVAPEQFGERYGRAVLRRSTIVWRSVARSATELSELLANRKLKSPVPTEPMRVTGPVSTAILAPAACARQARLPGDPIGAPLDG
jgi:hypothetical protein